MVYSSRMPVTGKRRRMAVEDLITTNAEVFTQSTRGDVRGNQVRRAYFTADSLE